MAWTLALPMMEMLTVVSQLIIVEISSMVTRLCMSAVNI